MLIARLQSVPNPLPCPIHTSPQDFTAADFLKSASDVPNLAGMKFTSKNFYLFQQIVDVSAQQVSTLWFCSFVRFWFFSVRIQQHSGRRHTDAERSRGEQV